MNIMAVAVVLSATIGASGAPRSTSGEVLFVKAWTTAEGVGPLANAQSCAACHASPRLGGGGRAQESLVMLSPDERDPTGGRLFRQFLFRPGRAIVRRPLPNEVFVRRPPSLLGSGVLEGISAAAIAAFADPDDRDRDGVSGRIAPTKGRFGWKARYRDVQEAVGAALVNELGLTNPRFSDGEGSTALEINDAGLRALTDYVRSLPPPLPDRTDSEGRSVFMTTGCATCHIPQLTDRAQSRGPTLEPFADLLLHDMGPALADGFDDEGIGRSEFRTPPLWGIGKAGPPYLHDGRAKTLDSAIRLHGGEGRAAVERYERLTSRQRAALLRFLHSL
jgi:CxxC motif-containing protein (DUF1111 family)